MAESTLIDLFVADLDAVALQRVHDFTEEGVWALGDTEQFIVTLAANPKEIRSMLLLFYSLGYKQGVSSQLLGREEK